MAHSQEFRLVSIFTFNGYVMATELAIDPPAVANTDHTISKPARDLVLQEAANELVFAVVGHVGSGTSEVANALKALLEGDALEGGSYQTDILKARREIEDWAEANGRPPPRTDRQDLATTESFQDLGDEMRFATRDNAAVAKALVKRIRQLRAERMGVTPEPNSAVVPDGTRRAYILDSIRHPAEVQLLRHIYQDAFVLIGVVCDEKTRLERIVNKYRNAGRRDAEDFMKRDAKAAEQHGQRVSDAFHLSDMFLDNSSSRQLDDGSPNPDWDINEHLRRLIKIITHTEVVRPKIGETAMHNAYTASMRSACMSRQVGAALVDHDGNVVATGTNEVPKAGGGVYGEQFASADSPEPDHRCVYRTQGGATPFCSSTREQTELVQRLIEEIPELNGADAMRKRALIQDIRNGGLGDILEFSRAVHAEMDALISAGRSGAGTVATRLFVTTYPCHYCARHIVTAGVDEVQFIEPYPKSRATDLHADSIQTSPNGWIPPSQGGHKVLFRPFVGVAPRMYRRAFLKDRELKDPVTGVLINSVPDWGTAWHLRKASYGELEAILARE
jgi:deoxycytidylate deaminase